MRVLFVCAILLASVCTSSMAQRRNNPQTGAPAPEASDAEKRQEEIDSGIPITSDAVRKACSQCHTIDEKDRMSRISWRRTTPEGWELTIKRMMALNGLQLEPAAAREVMKYLSTNLGLAPEEAKGASFEFEHRMIDYTYPDKDVSDVCTKCHSMGRVISQRRSKSEWELLLAMHRGLYPLSDFQAFRRGGPPQTEPGPDGRPPDNRHPMDKALPKLAEQLPLKTPEWSAWSANMRMPKLAGRWAFSGYQPGGGPLYGEFAIMATDKPDEFQTTTQYVEAWSGAMHKREGKSLVYTGFEWRGRSSEGGDQETMREVMLLDRNQREMTGRWFTGGYDEIGMDVTVTRVGADPLVLGVDHVGLPAGAARELRIYGANFPANLAAGAIDFGRGVAVKRVERTAPGLLKVQVEVEKDAAVGPRDLAVAGAVREGAAMVYDHVDFIKVKPQAGMARVGGIQFPKQFQQFEAYAYHNGADGKPNTKDDFELGPVPVKWGIEEYTATFDDNDKDYVGAIDANGLFTPNVDGPNPKRRGNGNNVGDVWVVASYQTADGKTIRGRAHLLVTVPLYINYDMAGRLALNYHRFQAAGREFLYLVPSAAVFELDDDAAAALDRPDAAPDETLAELRSVGAIGPLAPAPRQMPPADFPLTTMVLNVTNQCNLSCTYCYEYGEDKIVDTENGKKAKFMTEATARESVEFLLRESGINRVAHLTFFGGETLLNLPVVRSTIAYARERAAAMGKEIDFSLTTNATLLRPEVIEFLAENRVGVTISVDGPKEVQDQFRVFHNGAGSYEVVAPKIRDLLLRHTSRPIGARVTLTSQNLDIPRIFRHLREEIGFWEVGFAPVTTAPNREYAIADAGFDTMLEQFRALAAEFLEFALENRHHGFSNVKDTLEEIHKGVNKAYPCGAGLGLMGVSTDGDVALCHRFAGSDDHKLGTVSGGIDRLVQIGFLEKHHIDNKTDCSQCWARPLCSGGCYHEAHTRYGDTGRANLHYCEWIRGWTETCLKIYAELAVRNPRYLQQFDDEGEHEASPVN